MSERGKCGCVSHNGRPVHVCEQHRANESERFSAVRARIAAADDLADAMKKLKGWSMLARLLDEGLAHSIDSDPAWVDARAKLVKYEETIR